MFLATHKLKEIKLRWFQMRITYRILVTNSILKDMGILQDNNCSFCNAEKDSILHYLWSCPFSQNFWKEFEVYLKEKCPHCDRLKMKKSLVLFGCENNVRTDEAFDFILIHAKYFIYKCRFTHSKPNLNAFLNYLKYQHQVEEYVYKMEMRYDKFLHKWLLYHSFFDNPV